MNHRRTEEVNGNEFGLHIGSYSMLSTSKSQLYLYMTIQRPLDFDRKLNRIYLHTSLFVKLE